MYKNVTYSVRELFDRAWSTPVLRLAQEIGVSDVALSKACKKAGIPLPRRGYWAKPDEKRPKKPAPPNSTELVTFRVLDRSMFPPAPLKPAAMPKAAKLRVPTKLIDPHPLVRKWLQAVRDAKDVEGRVELRRERVLYTRISRDMVDRAALLLDTLIKDTEKRGCTWAVDDQNRTTVTFDGEIVYVTLRERVAKSAKLPPPPEPKRRRIREPVLWLGRREVYVYSSTGELTLITQEKPDVGSQKSWTDSKTGQLEDKLHLFCAGLRKVIERMRAYRASMEEWRRKHEAEEIIRRQATMKAEYQRTLQLRLVENMETWEKVVRLQRFIDAVAAGADGTGEDRGKVEAWVEWARAQVASIDPLGKGSTTSLDNDEPSAPGHLPRKEEPWWR
ncbi:hypothetical protein [Pseudomonas mediterranea]|uniref:hypothetical protein n=1 Tax=Pseudomonas mediterranea TaxID=183795 RepID=UPI0006D8C6C2|nr:hypothetical protein [Pseudomonas mediterranea]MDU9027638.1 hypothetical protein [Pseudomonas mediterranea]